MLIFTKLKKCFKYLLIFVILLAFVPCAQSQCAMCKEAAASSLKNDPSSMARSLNSGILYLMAVPYIALAFIFRKQIVSLYRKLRSRE